MTPDQAALIRKAQESLEAARLLAGKGFTSFAVRLGRCPRSIRRGVKEQIMPDSAIPVRHG